MNNQINPLFFQKEHIHISNLIDCKQCLILKALIKSPVIRSDLNLIGRTTNAPETISRLRDEGVRVITYRVYYHTALTGCTKHYGIYEIPSEGRPRALELLEQHKSKHDPDAKPYNGTPLEWKPQEVITRKIRLYSQPSARELYKRSGVELSSLNRQTTVRCPFCKISKFTLKIKSPSGRYHCDKCNNRGGAFEFYLVSNKLSFLGGCSALGLIDGGEL